MPQARDDDTNPRNDKPGQDASAATDAAATDAPSGMAAPHATAPPTMDAPPAQASGAPDLSGLHASSSSAGTVIQGASPAPATQPGPDTRADFVAASESTAAEAHAARDAGQEQRSPRDMPQYNTKHSEPPWSVLGRVIAARVRAWADRAGHRVAQRTLRIGVSARIFHPEPDGKGLRGKTLQYLEESISHWVMSRDVLVFMVPTVGKQGMLHASNIRLRDYAKHLDALVLQGGADVSPQSFAEPTTRPEWPGDRVRDMYELELLHEFIESGKPVLGVCRGCQLINVAFGGTLYQDIATDVPTALPHVNDEYDRLTHAIRFAEGASFSGMFGGRGEARVNSIHHQAVDRLGRDLVVEAVSADDGIVEAIRYQKAPFVVGVQWHPEFHRPHSDALLDCSPLLDHFLRAARETRF
ncbi:gamma-glutamyl-gamma-aminobutyrate hydrolase family protein [Robbsia andropogonis]|uniref:gamma-glutamyl-gamma-aminobutyrate hydrolase family protein n=1 Tax=Robbsia andropogonis TaxID=28092 RepID=UPI003D1E5D8C